MVDVRIGQNVNSKINPIFGKHIAIDDGFYSTTKCIIEDYVHIGPHCSVIGGKDSTFHMKPFSFLAAGSRIICASDEHLGHGFGIPWVPERFRDNVIRGNVTLERYSGVCTNAVICPGVTIAEGCIISAGCVISKSTEPWMIYIGNPARPIKERQREKILQYAKEMGY
jgi:acetyltransferase-like isoleucine patch superfamily enzyme